MAQGGTYGDNMEIQAFAKAYNYDVKIFLFDHAYYVRALHDGIVRPIAYIAYHVRVLENLLRTRTDFLYRLGNTTHLSEILMAHSPASLRFERKNFQQRRRPKSRLLLQRTRQFMIG
jgi:hypothetical protein